MTYKNKPGSHGIRHLLTLATALLSFIAISTARAAPGDLDGSFGAGGVVKTNVNPAFFRDLANNLFLRPDGRILATGSCDSGPGASMCIAQYNADGSLDTTFGNGGFAQPTFSDFGITYGFVLGSGAALQSDGALVIGGSCYLFGYWSTCVGRINADGSQDLAFGSNGKATPPITVKAITIQADGRIITAGHCGNANDFCVSRLNSDGSVDTGYGNGGYNQLAIGVQHDEINAVLAQTDGKVVAGGLCQVPGGPGLRSDFCIARYHTDGSIDTAFGNNGVVLTDVDPVGNSLEWVTDLAQQPDGKLVAAGRGGLIRYNTDGSYDTSFSGDGMIPGVYAQALALQQNGRIITVGGGGGTFTLARFNSDGSADTTIDGVDGILTFPLTGTMRFADEAAAYAVVLQDDGRILLAGTVGIPSTVEWNEAQRLDFALVRYLGDPTNHAPVCSGVTADINQINTPNHAMTLITLSGATDPDGDALTLTITGVTQDEPVNGTGDGNTSPDAAAGPVGNQVYVRGERAGNGDGRVYRIAFTVTDSNGGTCTGTGSGDGQVRVKVLHGKKAVESAAVYNSFAN